MFTYTLLASMCVVVAFESDQLNVGSALFAPSDLKKTRWSTSELSLLRARRHFQAMIPSPNTVDINENFVKSFLSFVKDSYTFVKKESEDSSTEKIMNAALSDTLGGFLKVWVLPVTKFAFYGGTVSQEEATKVFQLYDDIKSCLKTNGTNWRRPNPSLLSSMSISVAPFRTPITRRAQKPCDNIAFFEATDKGLAVPVPKVFWNKNSEYIFIPLKNISIVSLRDSFSNSLLKYYDSAKGCIKVRKRSKEDQMEDENNFEKRFQTWLEKEIVPHLSDECLYPALGSVLTLVNKSISLIDAMVEALDTSKLNTSQKWLADLHILVSSKKMLLVVIILMMEFICCIPTLACLFYARYKKPKKCHSEDNSLYVDYETYKNITGQVTGHCGTQYTASVKCVSIQNVNDKSEGPFSRPHVDTAQNDSGTNYEAHRFQARNTDLKNECATNQSKKDKDDDTITKQKTSQCTGNTSNFSAQTRPKYFDSRNISCLSTRNTYYKNSDRFSSEISNNLVSEGSLLTVQSLEPNKTVTIFKNNHNHKKTDTMTYNKSIQEKAKCTSTATDVIKELISKISRCKREHVLSEEILVASTLLDIPPPDVARPSPDVALSEKPTLARASKSSKKLSKGSPKSKQDSKAGSPPKKFVEIKIDGHRDIAFDIGNGETVEYTYTTRQSKIPKRVNEFTVASCSLQPNQTTAAKYKCMIPRRKAVDDTVITKKNPLSERQKLNMTL